MTNIRKEQTQIESQNLTISGTWTALTQPPLDNSTKLATTAYVDSSTPDAGPFNINGTQIYPDVYDSNLELLGGKISSVGFQIPPQTDMTFAAQFFTIIDANYGDGVTTGTSFGGAAISSGKLDLAHSDHRYIQFDARGNADSAQVGCWRSRITPNYSGTPAANQVFLNDENTVTGFNYIFLQHKTTTGNIALTIISASGTSIINNVDFDVWNPTAGTEYELELNWNLTTGATRLFIAGTQFGSTLTQTGTRDRSCDRFIIGSPSQNSNFKVGETFFFNSVQHTSNYSAALLFPLHNVSIFDGQSTLTGNVGIGNATPAYRLDLTTDKEDHDEQYIRIGCNNTTSNFSGGLIWKANFSTYTKISAAIRAVSEANFFRQGLAFYTGNDADLTTDAAEVMRLTTNGNLRVPAVYSYTVGVTNRDVYVDNSGYLGYVSSSIRFKENVDNTIDTSWIYDLDVVGFNYITSPNNPQIGLIAEQAELVNDYIVIYEQERGPDVITRDAEGNVIKTEVVFIDKLDKNGNKIPDSVQYSKLIVPILKELQIQKSRIDLLESRL